MINIKYAKAYTEVLEIIKYFPEDELNKISQEKIDYYKKNMDKDYKFEINPKIDLAEQNISKEASAIIISLFRDYFATEKQKQQLEILIKKEEEKNEKRKEEKYSPNDIFKSNQGQKQERENQFKNLKNEISMVEYKESFFERFRKIIFKLIYKK